MKRKRDKSIKLIKINKYAKLSIIIGCSVLIVLMLMLLLLTITKHKYIESKVPVYTYSNKGTVNYSVELAPNAIFSEKKLGENGVYISDFIDNINTVYRYEFRGDAPAKLSGKYNITAVVEGFLGNDKAAKSAWKKEFVLQPDTAFEGSDKVTSIEKQLSIKPSTYNHFIEQVTSASKVTFETKLTIYWNVTVDVKTDKGQVNEHLTSTMEFPPTAKFFEIKGDLQQMKNGKIERVEKVISPDFYKKIYIYSVLIVFSGIVLIFISIFTYSTAAVDPMERKLKQILSKYGDRIVKLNGDTNFKINRQINIEEIDDLARVSDDIGKPILYRKALSLSEKPVFYVIEENITYMYEMECNSTEDISSNKSSMGEVNITT